MWLYNDQEFTEDMIDDNIGLLNTQCWLINGVIDVDDIGLVNAHDNTYDVVAFIALIDKLIKL